MSETNFSCPASLKNSEKQLRDFHYDEMISNAVVRVFEDKDFINPWFVRLGLSEEAAHENDRRLQTNRVTVYA